MFSFRLSRFDVPIYFSIFPYSIFPYSIFPYSMSPYSMSPYSMSPCVPKSNLNNILNNRMFETLKVTLTQVKIRFWLYFLRPEILLMIPLFIGSLYFPEFERSKILIFKLICDIFWVGGGSISNFLQA